MYNIDSEKNMNILETDFKQREFDGKWERIVNIMDYDNKYTYISENGQKISFIPTRWLTVGVYDYLLSFED